ncbi:MAG TPA: hypothetical protein VK802_05300 [Streptosporangiaceae bacterium]|nr:hypothetical protein [Streptosporangiaceae bacterium]
MRTPSPGGDKDQARRNVAQWLAQGSNAWVRVNACSTPHYERGIVELADLAGLCSVVVPKADAPAGIPPTGSGQPPSRPPGPAATP